MYLIDTDVSLFAIRGNETILKRLGRLTDKSWAISAVTRYEIQKGIEANPTTRSSSKARAFLNDVETLNLNTEAATGAAQVYQALRIQGLSIGTADELIAGHALSLNATLVTNNIKHFEKVPGLKLESWV